VGRSVGKQGVSAAQLVRLTRRQVKSSRIAQRINRGVDLGTQPAPAASDGLLRRPPFALALC
jgi:hypothetical protein